LNIGGVVTKTGSLSKLEDAMVIARHVEFVIGSGWWNKPSFEYITDFGALIQWCSEGKSNRFIFNKVHDAGVIDSANCDFA